MDRAFLHERRLEIVSALAERFDERRHSGASCWYFPMWAAFPSAYVVGSPASCLPRPRLGVDGTFTETQRYDLP
jgi:hypothetical protein